MAYNNSTNIYSNSRYIVGATNSPYSTIQSAINAANAAGGNATVWVRSGTYNENLTLYSTVDIEGADSTLTIINGTHTPPNAGTVTFVRCGMSSATHVFSSAAAGSTKIVCNRCRFNLTNGYVYNLANWTGELYIRYSTDASAINGLVNNAGGSPVTINHSLIGAGTANVFTANGNVLIFGSQITCPILLNGTGVSVLDGGSVFYGNITTANTHALTLAQIRIVTGATQAITHNSATTAILNEVIVNSTNASAIGGTGTMQVMTVEFPNSNVIAGTVTVLLTGVTKTAEVWADNITRMKFTGFYSWAAGGPYFDDTTLGTFQLLVGGTGYIQGKRVTWVAQNYVGMTAGNTYIIYIDSTGTIGAATSHTDALYENNIVLFECLRDSTLVNNQFTVCENHPYSFPTSPSNYLHDTAGIVIENNNGGANITLNGTQGIQINGADVLNDHGISTTISDSGGVAETWYKYYTNAGGKWARQNATNTFTGFYNNAGTPTALTAGYYAVYRLYVTKQSLNAATPRYFAVLHTAQFNTINAARAVVSAGTAAAPTNELALLELCQLGFIIYEQSSASIVQVTISKATLRSTISSGGTNVASLVTTDVSAFDGILSATDTNVQAALNTIDEFGKNLTDHCVVVGNGNGLPLGVIGIGGTGELLVGAAGADPAFGTSANGNFTFTSATAGATRTLTVINTDNSAANSGANLQISVGGATSTGDPYVNFLVTGAGTYSVGIDNSVANDPFKITASASPSGGTDLFTMTNAGVITLANDLDVSEGGTGVSTLTSHGILMGNGAGDIQATAEPANGQIPIGKTGDYPQLATLTAGTGIAVTNGAGSITIASAAGAVVQHVYTGTTAVVDCSGNTPVDDTIPQQTEGTEVFTLAITPKSATNILCINFSTFGSTGGATVTGTAALFQDATAGALAAVPQAFITGGQISEIFFQHFMVSGTTSATTFKIRVGTQSGVHIYLNGSNAGGRYYGGVASTTFSITEYQA